MLSMAYEMCAQHMRSECVWLLNVPYHYVAQQGSRKNHGILSPLRDVPINLPSTSSFDRRPRQSVMCLCHSFVSLGVLCRP